MPHEPRNPSAVLEHIFTHANPQTGSQPPEHIAWVVFAEGTIFYAYPSDDLPADASLDSIEAAAKAALQELGPVIAGTPAADFNPVHLDAWFPDEHVFFVTYDHPAIATIVVADSIDPLTVGLQGRARRQADLEALQVRQVRGFTGQTRP